MAHYEPKTVPTSLSVDDYIASIDNDERRRDCAMIDDLMAKASKKKGTMWGTSIVGYGSYHYRYASGHEGQSCIIGFSSRKNAITIYVSAGFDGLQEELAALGRYKVSKGCLYIRNLGDVDMAVLKKLIKKAAVTVPVTTI